jgi:hypothetical protein
MSKSWKRKRRQLNEIPLLVERYQQTEQGHDQMPNGERLTYEEANWAKLSPTFRLAHNRLRQTRGLPTIPPPLVDLYVKPRQPLIRPFDPSDKEVQLALAQARMFDGPMPMVRGNEGFTIKK